MSEVNLTKDQFVELWQGMLDGKITKNDIIEPRDNGHIYQWHFGKVELWHLTNCLYGKD